MKILTNDDDDVVWIENDCGTDDIGTVTCEELGRWLYIVMFGNREDG